MKGNQTELILAGPGTGKTTTLVNRVIELLRNVDQRNNGIILCTFTRKATEELTQRIYGSLSMTEVNRVNFLIGTIHSICFELLKRYSTTDYSDYSILDESEQIHFIHSKLKNLGYPTTKGWSTAEDLAAIFNKINDQEVDVNVLDFSSNQDLLLACNAYPLYRRLLDRFRLFDFASIQSTFLSELRNSLEFKNRIREDFTFFFVDEYQDINPIQHKIFKELSSPEYNLTVVGDDDQCIYEFRGSDVSLIRSFKTTYTSLGAAVQVSILNTNYRSTGPIVKFTNNLLTVSGQQNLEKQILPYRNTTAHEPVIHYFPTDTEEIDFIINNIRELKERGVIKSFKEIAILYRSVKYHSVRLIQALEDHHIPYVLNGAGSFFESVMGEEFIALLDYVLAKDEDYKSRFFDAIADIDLIHHCDLTTLYSEKDYLERLDAVLSSNQYASCIDLTYDILSICDFFVRYSKDGPNIGTITSIVSSFDEFSSAYDPWNLFSFITYLKKKQDVDYIVDDQTDGVQIMTIHQCKGLEFPVVFIPSLVERSQTSSLIDKFEAIAGLSKNREAEEFRILYVACTRAEELLVLTGSETILDKRKRYSQNRYIKEYIKKYGVAAEKLDLALLFRQDFRKKNAINTDNPTLSYNSISLYRMCPRAYMYSHVWHLETKRIGGMEFGKNVHKIIETILRKIMGGVSAVDIDVKKEVENAWKASSVRSFSSDEKYKAAALKQVLAFMENSKSYLTKDGVFSSEDLFNISIGGNLITGRFDAVVMDGSQYKIIDFKTGDPRNYSGQLSFYAVCFKEKYEIEEDLLLSVYYLKLGKYETITGNDPKLEIDSIIDVASKIRAHEFPANPGKVCQDCAFNNICEFKKL